MGVHRTLARVTNWITLGFLLASGTHIGTALAQSGQEVEIEITDSGFRPAEIVVDVGTTVTWNNVGSDLHSVLPDGEVFGDASGTFGISSGESFSYTFQEEGEFKYSDIMGDAGNSTVIVGNAASAAVDNALPAEQAQVSPLLLAAQQGGLPAAIVIGNCAGDGEEVAALNPASLPLSSAVGSERAVPGANSFTTIAIGMDALTAEEHALVVTGPHDGVVACGEIGGRLTDSGSLIVGLHQESANDLGGVVVFSPADSPTQANVSLFVVGTPLRLENPAAAVPSSSATIATPPEANTADLAQDSEPTATVRPTEIPLPTPTPVPLGLAQNNPAQIGTTIESQELAVTVTGAYFDYGFANAIPRGGYKVLIISATIQNNSDGNLGYDASRFSAIDATNGNTYDPVTIDDVGVLLTNEDLQPGEYVSGIALVEVQETASNVIIKYDVDILGDDDMYWQ